MADVIGPNSYLPGQHLASVSNTMCDDHPDRPSVVRIVGETDSFGSELIDLCQECVDKMKAEIAAEEKRPQECDWCHTKSTSILPTRDWEEGTSGPVYYVCQSCRKKQRDAAYEELDRYANDRDD